MTEPPAVDPLVQRILDGQAPLPLRAAAARGALPLPRTTLAHLYVLLRRDEVVILDMYAGVEHLGRATANAVDAMLVVVEPTARSLGTADQIRKLAMDLKLEKVFLLGSKVESEEDRKFIEQGSPGLEVLAHFPDDPAVREADRKGLTAYDLSPKLASASKNLASALMKTVEVG